MDPNELEDRLREAEIRLEELAGREKKLHNLVLRLSAVVMALSERLQEKKIIGVKEFEARVQTHLKSLDREISDRRTSKLLEDLFAELEEEDPEA